MATTPWRMSTTGVDVKFLDEETFINVHLSSLHSDRSPAIGHDTMWGIRVLTLTSTRQVKDASAEFTAVALELDLCVPFYHMSMHTLLDSLPTAFLYPVKCFTYVV